jgi:hypothetical protein
MQQNKKRRDGPGAFCFAVFKIFRPLQPQPFLVGFTRRAASGFTWAGFIPKSTHTRRPGA